MKISVQGEDRNVHLNIPTSRVFSKPSAWIAVAAGGHYAGDAFPDLSVEDMERLLSELRRIENKHKDWCLVEVESASGSHIRITL